MMEITIRNTVTTALLNSIDHVLTRPHLEVDLIRALVNQEPLGIHRVSTETALYPGSLRGGGGGMGGPGPAKIL